MYVRMPATFINIVVGKIRFFAFFVYITGKYYFGIKAQTLKSVFNGPNATKRSSEPYLSFRVRKMALRPNGSITIKKISLGCDTCFF